MFRNSGSTARRAGATTAVLGLVLIGVATLSGSASAAPAPAPTITPANGSCEGVKPTDGSGNTDKRLVGGTLAPGGTAEFEISYPVTAAEVDAGTTFTIIDCVYIGGVESEKYQISFVPNTTNYILSYALNIPDDAPLGVQYCNYAKTTGTPSAAQASNRKAGPACFSIAGALTVEKRAGSVEGDLLPGATFSVVCTPTSRVPALQVVGLDGDGVATDGTISIAGPENTPCTITELAAPEGYTLAAPVQAVIPRGTAPSTIVMVDAAAPTEEPSVEPTVEPTETPSVEPTVEPTVEVSDEPTVEPGDPTPSISPTVKGVKIVKAPPELPRTGAPTGLLVAAGLALVAGGVGMTAASARYARQH